MYVLSNYQMENKNINVKELIFKTLNKVFDFITLASILIKLMNNERRNKKNSKSRNSLRLFPKTKLERFTSERWRHNVDWARDV